jgi:hypothetical protein
MHGFKERRDMIVVTYIFFYLFIYLFIYLFAVLWIDPGALCMLDKNCSTKLYAKSLVVLR